MNKIPHDKQERNKITRQKAFYKQSRILFRNLKPVSIISAIDLLIIYSYNILESAYNYENNTGYYKKRNTR